MPGSSVVGGCGSGVTGEPLAGVFNIWVVASPATNDGDAGSAYRSISR
jgi:hypothetical protein